MVHAPALSAHTYREAAFMRSHSRILLRAAARIRDQYVARAALRRPVAAPHRAWTELQRLARLQEIARYRGWQFAAQQLDRQLQGAVVTLRSEIESLLAGLHRDRSASCPTLRDVYAELVALHDEFEHVTVDLKLGSVTVRTEPVVLEDVDLGPFNIRFEWKRLYHSPPYWVVAVDPHPAASDSELVHPHVRNETLCEGEGKAPIKSALEQGRLCDLFLTVMQVLNTYNAGSPYVSLAHWEGSLCADCGTVVDDENECFCVVCHDTNCWDCSSRCEGCEESCCQGCIVTCDGCDEPHCPHCLKNCRQCKGDYCADCRDEDGRCAECAAPSKNPQPVDAGGTTLPAEAPPPLAAPPPETAAPHGAAAAVLPHRLGEIAVPA
jgi:hypothetical protein